MADNLGLDPEAAVDQASDADEEPGDTSPSDVAVHATALERMELAAEAEQDIRKHALDDLKFISGDQWEDGLQQERTSDGRPCLVINRLPQFVQQVTNDQRQNRPAIKVHPVGDGADVDTAKVIQGIIRHIEYNSNAEVAYDTAGESAARGGFGYLRVITDFVSPESFDQEILIKRIRNPFSVFFDPYAEEPDGSDASWAFITDDLSPDAYRAAYPNSELAKAGADWSEIGNQCPSWVKSDGARVAEYFYKDMRTETIHLLGTGEVVRDADLQKRQQDAANAGLDASVKHTRQTKIPIVRWLKINGVEILEQTDWIGSFIPIIPVYGNEIYVNGRRILESVIRHAKDPQRMYNYWKSAETEAIALAPRAPFIAAEGQLEGYEKHWESANRRNHAYLYYKPTTIAGQMAPPPARQAVEPAVQAITQASMMAADELKATTGIYDPALGRQSNETSGIAIQRRNNQTQTANFHFTDNLHRSLRHVGRILVEIIPSIYDTARSVRIIGEDGTQKMVRVNDPSHKGEDGKQKLYSLESGRYDVAIDTGPSFASKRQEAAASMQEMTRAAPQLMGIAGDIMVRNMDWPGSEEVAERIKKSLPPGLQDAPNMKDVPPQVTATLQQQQQMIKQLSQNLDETTKVIETKKMELESRERIEVMKLQAEMEMKLADIGAKSNIALLQEEVATLRHESGQLTKRLNLLGINEPIESPNDFNPQNADGGNYAGIGHIGGGANLTGEDSPGKPIGDNP